MSYFGFKIIDFESELFNTGKSIISESVADLLSVLGNLDYLVIGFLSILDFLLEFILETLEVINSCFI